MNKFTSCSSVEMLLEKGYVSSDEEIDKEDLNVISISYSQLPRCQLKFTKGANSRYLVFLFLSFGLGKALKCFICDGCGKFDMNTRQHVQTCDAGEFFCKKEEAEDGLGWTKIFKECSASCTESDSYNNRVKCCTTDICNTGISYLVGY
ncbi:hypothetical protein BpHYR1_051412 [Brachionus plicatilis]|uniref:Snake toxin/toxin-like domain-containing protein n=1 Tax=Brachionus plicatilis TaxID=10195 RepID=A0A3M7S2J2_BRAPC|nr:hypothetical protein BpHYR1_051412 [Brachionus plicatilis]